MNEKNNESPEINEVEAPKKPTPPLPPPPGEGPAAPPPAQPSPMPAYDPGPSPPKSPPLAAILAILIPGLGHLYLWAYERAFMIWATIAVCVFMIVNGYWPFSFLIAFVYFFSIFDAYREAQFFNLRAEDEEATMPRTDNHGRLMFGVFLAVAAGIVLADKFDLFDMEWLLDWWSVPVFLLGVYFIIAAILDRKKARDRDRSADAPDQY